MRPKTPQELDYLRISGHILHTVYETVRPKIAAGTTTKQIADVVRSEIKSHEGEAVLLGYRGFPDVVCISVNEQVVHGIPGDYILQSGDVVSLDLCVGYRGMITDSAFTAVVGDLETVNSRTRTLLRATEQALYTGIDVVRSGVHTGDIGHVIQRRLLQDNLGVIEDLVGHGVGHAVHEDPDIPNYGSPGQGPILKSGMTVAIEPMATLGGKAVVLEPDRWTVRTRDRSLSAHFEHTVLVTDEGFEILT